MVNMIYFGLGTTISTGTRWKSCFSKYSYLFWVYLIKSFFIQTGFLFFFDRMFILRDTLLCWHLFRSGVRLLVQLYDCLLKRFFGLGQLFFNLTKQKLKKVCNIYTHIRWISIVVWNFLQLYDGLMHCCE